LVKPRQPARGDIWLCALDPTMGREIQKTRPCLIVSPDVMNAHLATVTVLPLTSKGRPAAFRPPITFDGVTGLVLADQMRTVDRSRLRKHLGVADAETLGAVLGILREMFEA